MRQLESYFDDVACNRAQHGILLLCRTKDGRDWPPIICASRSENRRRPCNASRQRLSWRGFRSRRSSLLRVRAAIFGKATSANRRSLTERPSVEADRFAPVAILETANTTPNSTGARKLAVAGRTVYAQMTRMGGSGWGEMISVRWPGESKTDEGKAPRTDSPIKLNIEEFKSALGAARFYGSNQGASYLCNSPDGRKVFFATRYEDEAHKLRFYLGDDTGEVHPLDQLQIEDPE